MKDYKHDEKNTLAACGISKEEIKIAVDNLNAASKKAFEEKHPASKLIEAIELGLSPRHMSFILFEIQQELNELRDIMQSTSVE